MLQYVISMDIFHQNKTGFAHGTHMKVGGDTDTMLICYVSREFGTLQRTMVVFWSIQHGGQ
jgi:hypothetical protein